MSELDQTNYTEKNRLISDEFLAKRTKYGRMLTKYSDTGLAKPRLGRLLHAPLYEVRLKRFRICHFWA